MKNFFKKNKNVVITSVILSFVLVAGLVAVKGVQIFSPSAKHLDVASENVKPVIRVKCENGKLSGVAYWVGKKSTKNLNYVLDVNDHLSSWNNNDGFWHKYVSYSSISNNGTVSVDFPSGAVEAFTNARMPELKPRTQYVARVLFTDSNIYTPETVFTTPDCR